jgi:iron complex transport system permease protein
MDKAKTTIKFVLLFAILIVLALIDLTSGHMKIPISEIFKFFLPGQDASQEFVLIIKEFRFPRALVAILTGAALSVSGLLMQSSFRNPLAGPYVLGISSGASLGVAIIVLSSGFIASIGLNAGSKFILIAAAGIGAAAVLLIILLVSLRLKDNLSILIVGILIAGVVGSIVSILQYYGNSISVKSFVIWTMGSLNSVSFADIKILSILVLIPLSIVFLLSKKLNLILPGESFALSMGVKIKNVRLLIYILVSILTGAVTAFCGPIGFIGIAVPHIARWIFNSPNHYILIPATILLGGAFLLSSDILTIIIPKQGVLPINAITAIMGAPFIIWVIIRNKRTIV